MSRLLITHAHVISPGIDLPDSQILIEDGKITSVGEIQDAGADQTLDAGGNLVVPGFIDIHTHGAGGASVMDGTEDAIRKMAEMKLREGVTTFMPTTWTEQPEALTHAAQAVAAYHSQETAARTPSLHIEGPYLNPDCAGAQNPAYMRLPDAEEIAHLDRLYPVGIVSLAGELEGAPEFIQQMRQKNVVCSLAHTAATWEDFLQVKEAGLTHLTHYCNQMTRLHHREIGIVGAGLLDDDILLEMICDTIHLCPEMIQLAFKHIPLHRIMLITDSISASWMPDGTYMEAGLTVHVVGGTCRLPEGNLAGSTARYYECLRNVRDLTGRPLEDLIQTTSWNQAQSLRLNGFGKVEAGFHADLALLNPETLEPQHAIVGGDVRL